MQEEGVEAVEWRMLLSERETTARELASTLQKVEEMEKEVEDRKIELQIAERRRERERRSLLTALRELGASFRGEGSPASQGDGPDVLDPTAEEVDTSDGWISSRRGAGSWQSSGSSPSFLAPRPQEPGRRGSKEEAWGFRNTMLLMMMVTMMMMKAMIIMTMIIIIIIIMVIIITTTISCIVSIIVLVIVILLVAIISIIVVIIIIMAKPIPELSLRLHIQDPGPPHVTPESQPRTMSDPTWRCEETVSKLREEIDAVQSRIAMLNQQAVTRQQALRFASTLPSAGALGDFGMARRSGRADLDALADLLGRLFVENFALRRRARDNRGGAFADGRESSLSAAAGDLPQAPATAPPLDLSRFVVGEGARSSAKTLTPKIQNSARGSLSSYLEHARITMCIWQQAPVEKKKVARGFLNRVMTLHVIGNDPFAKMFPERNILKHPGTSRPESSSPEMLPQRSSPPGSPRTRLFGGLDFKVLRAAAWGLKFQSFAYVHIVDWSTIHRIRAQIRQKDGEILKSPLG
ncbi:hypothetical protein AK812_SmicGene41401 [Symbiodinium microadriaticum]|uniref:Uncharacterized protein n=1 Tax=Symbiodinium microadriaticum TaxID=2951 RepID=A0A1Q9C680_SYMMI|nr:hypothetical protein AK812_SmicGene41401 [Symbiodinium microadriaticum]